MSSEFERSFTKDTIFKKVKRVFHRNNPLDTSSNSYNNLTMPNPESDSHSRREFSPVSNTSKSPHGGTLSITPPKINFTYKNPMKYSSHLL